MLVEVTYACKMGCTHCLSDCKPDGEHMTLEVFEDVLKFMIKNQIPTWSFSGGEMFEHPDILKMLSLIESYWKTLPIKYPITFATNGRELVRNKKIYHAVSEFLKHCGKRYVMIQVTDDPRFYPDPLTDNEKYWLFILYKKGRILMNHNRNAHYWENRDERKERAYLHTKNMAYVFSDHIEQCVRNTKLYDDTNTFDELNPVLTREVSVVDLDTVSAIFRYKRKEKRTAILNFASYKNAGGMFLQGSSAQEESLCHASFLYNVLSEFKDYYAWNDKHKNRALYENRALYSPDVVFTNDSVGTLCDVITCAAPNKSAAQKYCHVSDEENYNALESRIRFVLHIAEKEKVDTLILGAYGAGVFGQDATEVAQIFKRLLIEEFWTFEKIIFAIPDCSRNKNYKKFLDVMSDTIM